MLNQLITDNKRFLTGPQFKGMLLDNKMVEGKITIDMRVNADGQIMGKSEQTHSATGQKVSMQASLDKAYRLAHIKVVSPDTIPIAVIDSVNLANGDLANRLRSEPR